MKLFAALTLTALPLALAAPLQGQSPRELIERSLEMQDARLKDVQNYTVVQEFNGQEMLQYYEPRVVGGHRIFIPTRTVMGGRVIETPDDQSGDPFATYQQWIDGARVTGSETVDGHDAWIIETDAVEAMGGSAMSNADLREGHVKMFLDKSEYIMRKMEFEGTAVVNDESRHMAMTAELLDYRNVEGVLQPFTVKATIDGAVSETESEQMRQALADMEKQLAELPEAVRKQVEGQLRAQVEAMGGMATGGAMTVTLKTSEIRVNQGPPGA